MVAVPHSALSPAALGKRFAARLLSAPFPYRLLQARAHRGDPVTILCYHTLRADDDALEVWLALRMSDFRAQMAFLRQHYRIVSIDEALDDPDGRRPRAVVTFDDGDVGLIQHLLPFVEEEHLPVTVYIATRQIESGRPYWFDAVMNALQSQRPVAIDLQGAGLGTWTVRAERTSSRWLDIAAILEMLKRLDPTRREEVAAMIVRQGEAAAPDRFRPLGPMSVDQVRRLSQSRWVTIGSHSHCHNLLDQIPTAAVRDSLARSRSLLEDWTSRPVLHFAYPNGNHNPHVQHVVAETGHRTAVALGDRLWVRGTDPYVLPRIGIGRYDSLSRFALRLTGV